MSGFVVIDRKILDWKWYQSDAALRLWITLIIKANWKDGYFCGEQIPRGSLATSLPRLADLTGLHPTTIRRWLRTFEAEGMIEQKVTNRFRVIKVLNYSTFQDIEKDEVNRQKNSLENSPENSLENSPEIPNRTIKQEEQRNNYPPKPPQRGSRRKSSIVIETPDWYKRQKDGETDPEPDPAETDAIIAEIEEMKRQMFNQ